MSQKEPEPLPRAFGPYTLLKLLARGGMGEIYLARTGGLAEFEKYYAVKKLLAKFVKDPDVTTRFVDEAKLGARLGHPNIVQVYDLGRIGDELYMAAEFVDGFDLRRILRFCHEKGKRISLDIALFIVREILSGLAYAHRQVDAQGRPIELVHRDISPQNVLVSFEGEVKIIDFGLAKSTQRSQETQANVLLGNFGYMSPEQARGKKLDVRTDVYSTGIVLFELVTGTKRFVDDNPLSLLEKVANPTPLLPSERVPGGPREVDALFMKATSAKREDRYADAAEFRDEVSHALYRLNPRASREHLAEFLNYLFLGGKPPKEPEGDLGALHNSVSLRVGDFIAGSAAFQSSKEQDSANRRLADSGVDKEPTTQTHALMKSARLGDKIALHELFKGEPAAAARAPVAPAAPAMPPIQTPAVGTPTASASAPTALTHVSMPPPAPARPPSVEVSAMPPAPPAAPARPPSSPPPAPATVQPQPELLNESALIPVEEDDGADGVVHADVTLRAPVPHTPAPLPATPTPTFGRPATGSLPPSFGRPATGARPAGVGLPPPMPPARPAPPSMVAPAAPAVLPQPAPPPSLPAAAAPPSSPANSLDVPITRWSLSATSNPNTPPALAMASAPGAVAPATERNAFAMGTATAESLIIDFDEVEGARPTPRGVPAQGGSGSRLPAAAVVTDEGAPAAVRPAMQPGHKGPGEEPPPSQRWVLKREGQAPPAPRPAVTPKK